MDMLVLNGYKFKVGMGLDDLNYEFEIEDIMKCAMVYDGYIQPDTNLEFDECNRLTFKGIVLERPFNDEERKQLSQFMLKEGWVIKLEQSNKQPTITFKEVVASDPISHERKVEFIKNWYLREE